MRKPKLSLVLLALALSYSACKQSKNQNKASDCVSSIFKQDDSLGNIRNHGSETKSLSLTINEYANALGNLDFANCPQNFTKAFKDHENAWRDMIQVADSYPDLRGELHDIFDQIETSPDSLEFKKRLKHIWDTWGIIEEASK